MNKADELKKRRQETLERSQKMEVELKRLTELPDAENGGLLAHYNVDEGKVDIYGPLDKQQATVSEENFKKLLAWGNKLFNE